MSISMFLTNDIYQPILIRPNEWLFDIFISPNDSSHTTDPAIKAYAT